MPIQLNSWLPVIPARFVTRLGIYDKSWPCRWCIAYARSAARALCDRREELITQPVVRARSGRRSSMRLETSRPLIAIDGRRPNVLAVGEIWRGDRPRIRKRAAAEKAGKRVGQRIARRGSHGRHSRKPSRTLEYAVAAAKIVFAIRAGAKVCGIPVQANLCSKAECMRPVV